jgi:hypothetical protein
VVQLLQAAIAGGSDLSFQVLRQLPAAQQLSNETAVQLLQAAWAGRHEPQISIS